MCVHRELPRLSHVVQLILDTEIESAKGLSVLVDKVLEQQSTRYQFLDNLLELSLTIARLRNDSSDAVFQKLSSVPKTQLADQINKVLGRDDLHSSF